MKVTVHHPLSNRSWDMEVEGSATPTSLVNDLIEESHLPRTPEGYELHVKGGELLNMDASLESSKVADNAQLMVLPRVKGGAVLR
jgi:hypothetical protein